MAETSATAEATTPNLGGLDFQVAAGLGPDNPILRGVVGLMSRTLLAENGEYEDFNFEREADQLSQLLFHSSLIVALDAEKAWRPTVASVLVGDGLRNRGRTEVELSSILASPDYAERDLLTGVMVALACGGRKRLRPAVAFASASHEHPATVLSDLGFRKEEALTASTDFYAIGAGQLAVQRAKRLPGGRAALRQARQNLRRS